MASAPVTPEIERRAADFYSNLLTKDGKVWKPRTRLGFSIFKALRYLPADLAAEIVDRISSIVVVESSLALKVIRPYHGGLKVEDLGVVSHKVVTDAGVQAIVDAFQNLVELENFKYHGLGTGSTAEAAGDTALVTELTTEYNPDGTRATGTTTENGANVFETVATNTVDGAASVVEHGVFTQATVGGTLLDRSVFAAVNLSSGDSLQSTYDLTLNSGG